MSDLATIGYKTRHLETRFTEINKKSNWKVFTKNDSMKPSFCCSWPWHKPGKILTLINKKGFIFQRPIRVTTSTLRYVSNSILVFMIGIQLQMMKKRE